MEDHKGVRSLIKGFAIAAVIIKLIYILLILLDWYVDHKIEQENETRSPLALDNG